MEFLTVKGVVLREHFERQITVENMRVAEAEGKIREICDKKEKRWTAFDYQRIRCGIIKALLERGRWPISDCC
ncbi:hypothetical protein LCGC14_2094820 [marine sediment metagenome]|uniref:Uncharacterized protein n=1 Tax=marine sediment metagenome TaxID=412755 RepID=A0A0F9H8F1_9ZZZZ